MTLLNCFNFLDGAHLAQNVLNRLKINVKTDPRSVDKIQNLFDEFIQSAEKENFQREFAKTYLVNISSRRD